MGALGTALMAISTPVVWGSLALVGCSPASDGIRESFGLGGTNTGAGSSSTGAGSSSVLGTNPAGQTSVDGSTPASPGPPEKDSGPSGVGGSAIPGATGGTASPGDTSCPDPEAETFSFFLTSRDGLAALAGNPDGFGGNLGGLVGADDKCRALAATSTSAACESRKTWRAFLSTSTVNAVDRIGSGPWHDRRGRLLANGLTDLLADRPANAERTIKDDLPNEWGIPNHTPAGDGVQVDNHCILTGSGTDGKLYNQSSSGGSRGGSWSGSGCGSSGGSWSAEAATCWDWTSNQGQGCPRVGHSWPRNGSGTNWISVYNEGGCLPGGQLTEQGGLDGTARVGSSGGYGGFYCFAILDSKN